MPINENIYGSPSSWDSPTSNQFITDFKIVDYGTNQHTLQDAVTLGKFNKDTPIDKSIAYMGIGKECNYSNPKYFTKENDELVIKEFAKRDVTNTALYIKGDTTGYYAGSYRFGDSGTALSSDINIDWSGVNNTNNINKPVQFVADFNIKNLVMLVYVVCASSTTGSAQVYTLAEYANHATQYPYIRRVYGELYGVNAPYTSRRNKLISGAYDNSEISIASLDSVKYNDKDIYRYTQVRDSSARENSITIIGTSDGTHDTRYDWLFYDCELENKSALDSNYFYYNGLITDYISFKEIALKAAAQFGLYFTDNLTTARDGAYTDTNMYIGLIDENGISHGLYAKGTDTSTAIQNTWNSVRDSKYDHTKDVDTTSYDNTTHFNYTLTSRAFTKMYVLTDNELSALANELYTAVHQAPSGEEIERYNQSVFLTQNPIDCIISLKQFPIELPFSVSQNMKLGSYTCTTTGAPLLYPTGVYEFLFSSSLNNTVFPVYGKSFLDYEPYTKCELSIPFCGTVEIPVSYIYDYDAVEVELVIDYITGACTAYIISNGITIDSVQGNCAISLPVSGIQAATLDSQIHTAATERNKSALTNGLGLIGGLAAVAIGVGTGGIGAAVMGGIATLASGANMLANDKKIEYDLQHMQLPLKQVGAASGAISLTYDMRCKMRITRPKLDPNYDSEVYANTVGFACLLNGSVQDFHGLTSGIIKLDGVPCTAEEKDYIASMFTNGVYLP